MNNRNLSNKTKITNHMALFVGSGLGFLCSLTLLSGDESGRVNILFLLLLFVVVPLAGILLSAFSFFGKDISAHLRLNELILFLGKVNRQSEGIWSPEMKRLLLLYHTQYGAVGWAFGSIIALMALLTFTDINFVWRSTLLSPDTLLPVLEWVSAPWFFWEAAQPSAALLTATQDSRLTVHQTANIAFGQWWPFILACQLFYSFLLRTIAMLLLRLKMQRKLVALTETPGHAIQDRKKRASLPQKALTQQLPHNFILVNWAGFTQDIIQQLGAAIRDKSPLMAGPLATEEQHAAALRMDVPQLLLVKAWEPPLEQLRDYLLHTKGMIAPIDIKSGSVMYPQQKHIEEWNRSIADMPGWTLFIGKDTK